jgi:hypothetical protein
MRTLCALAVLLAALPAKAAMPVEVMIQLTLRGQRVEGTPIDFNEAKVHLLGRDGRLWEFKPSEASDFRKSADRFQAFSVSEFRAALLRELGPGFEVTGTGHYLVAHPAGQRDVWAQRFEDLYRSLVHYWGVRGFTLREPSFPLVGVVCANRRQFDEVSARGGGPVGSGVLGYYDLLTNRILLYDLGSSAGTGKWQTSAKVLIHEATHQTAYNTGIQSRYTRPPKWVSEGLATMFEAPGVYDSRNHTQLSDRINRGRLDNFRQMIPHHRAELISGMVADEQLFRVSPGAAYAEAWALTFYLVETQPRKYADYLARTARMTPFTDYSATQRTADFQACFGADWRMLEAQLLRFIAGLK